jgi:hypothetical protein
MKIFAFCKLIFYEKLIIFLGKKVGEKFKMAAKNENAVGQIFLNRNSTETLSSGFIR